MTTLSPTLLAVHTDAPRDLLRTMVSGTDVFSGAAAGGVEDCIYGWGEALEPARGCRQHNMVYTEDEETAKWVASTLITLGYQVVVSSAQVWSEQRADLPWRYDAHHSH
jgi:hypothetical protein